jgi:hypothetical protein
LYIHIKLWSPRHTLSDSSAVTVDNVPTGKYYARMRAINDVGMSLTSNEIVVVVP